MDRVDPLESSSFASAYISTGTRDSVPLMTGAPRLSVLVPKIQMPRPAEQSLSRPRLLDLMDRAARRKVTILSAPPGYGKSTLITQWALRRPDRNVAWVSMDEDDNDPSTLFRHIFASIHQFDPDGVDMTLQLLDGPSLSTRMVVHSLLNDLAELRRPTTIVLDDFQSVTSAQVLDHVNDLIEHLPQGVHIVIASRVLPELNLWRLRSHADVFEIGEEELRFTSSELTEFLQLTAGVAPAQDEIEAVAVATEGWIAGVILLSLAVQEGSTVARPSSLHHLQKKERNVSEFLWTEVLLQQNEAVRTFLLEVSIVDSFSCDLCDALTGRSNGREMIDHLVRSKLFLVGLDDRGEWYRFHHLMNAAIRMRAADHASIRDLRLLHTRAAKWFEAQAMPEDAARHAIAGQDWDRALRLLPKICGELYRQDRLAAMLTWLEDLPSAVLEQNPTLCYWQAWALARLGKFGNALEPLTLAEHVWRERNDTQNLAAAQSLHVLQDIIQGNADKAAARAARALQTLPETSHRECAVLYTLEGLAHYYRRDLDAADESLARSRTLAASAQLSSVILSELNTSGGVLIARGRLGDAAALFEQVLATGDPWSHQAIQHAEWLLATVEIERNQLAQASQRLETALMFADRMNAILHSTQIHQLRAEIAWIHGERDLAFANLDLAVASAERIEASGYLAAAHARRARFWLDADQLILARRWASDTDLDPFQSPGYERLYEYLTLIRLMIAGNRSEAAIAMLDLVESDAASRGDVNTQIECLVLRAVALQGLDNRVSALKALGTAIELGAPGRYTRIFLDHGLKLDSLLDDLLPSHPQQAAVQRILSAIAGHEPAAGNVSHVGSEILSRREIEILRLVAVGASNREAADRLFISEATVKKHLSNISAKLDSANRTQAVDRARKLGLI